MVVEELHAELRARLDRRVDAERFIFADQVADGRRAHENFVSRAAAAADLRQQGLADHADDRRGELRAHLLLLVRREGVDDAVHRALGARGVERAKHHVARLGRRDRRLDRFEIAKLAHEDHVGVLPQRAAEGLGEARHVVADLALVHRALLRLVVKLDRIFDRDDVVVVVGVDVVDQAGERGRFAGARRARHEKQPARPADHLLADFGHAELLGREHLVGDLPQDHRHAAALLEHAHAKPGHVAKREAEVGAALLGQLGLAALGRDRLHEAVGVVGREHLRGLRLHVAVDAKHGGQAGRDVDVAHAALHGGREELVDLDRARGHLGLHDLLLARGVGGQGHALVFFLDVELERGVGHEARGLGLGFVGGAEHEDLRARVVDERAHIAAAVGREEKLGRVGMGWHDRLGHRRHFVGGDRAGLEGAELVVDAEHRGHAAGEPQLGGAVVDGHFQQLLDLRVHRGGGGRAHGDSWRRLNGGNRTTSPGGPPREIIFCRAANVAHSERRAGSKKACH